MMFGDGFEQATILRATPTARQDSAQASSNPAMRKDVLLHGVPEQHPQRHGCAWLDSFVDGAAGNGSPQTSVATKHAENCLKTNGAKEVMPCLAKLCCSPF